MSMPAPARSYDQGVSLRARSARGAKLAEDTQTPADVEQWLLGPALDARTLMDLFEPFCWRILAAGLPVHRATLNVGTLHPQLIGLTWVWETIDGLCDETRIMPEALESDAFRNSPIYRAIEFGETVQCDPHDPATQARYPLMADLVARGLKDYRVQPLATGKGGNRHRITISLASRQAGGLSGPASATLQWLCRLLTPQVARLMAERVAGNIAEAYLGEAAGHRVLAGSIRRGTGEAMPAVVLVSDLRGYTSLSNRLAPEAVLAILNAVFERQVAAIEAERGEVLKFMGDGLLAVFPTEGDPAAAALRAFRAADFIQASLADLNANPPPALADLEGWSPLRLGIALHIGEVFFGNVGAPERLDFTVVGPAVNIAARVEALTKTLHRPVLMTEAVASLLRPAVALEPLGLQQIYGLSSSMQVYAMANEEN